MIPTASGILRDPQLRNRILRIVVVDLVFVAILAGLYFLTPRPSTTSQTDLVGGSLIGAQAPVFSLDSPDGRNVRLEELRGRPVMVNFWATWCEPCKAEIPALDAVAQSTNTAVVGVSVSDPAEAVMAFQRRIPFDYPVALDSDQAVTNAYHVRNLPTTFFIDRAGIIRAVHVGALTEDAARQELARIAR